MNRTSLQITALLVVVALAFFIWVEGETEDNTYERVMSTPIYAMTTSEVEVLIEDLGKVLDEEDLQALTAASLYIVFHDLMDPVDMTIIEQIDTSDPVGTQAQLDQFVDKVMLDMEEGCFGRRSVIKRIRDRLNGHSPLDIISKAEELKPPPGTEY